MLTLRELHPPRNRSIAQPYASSQYQHNNLKDILMKNPLFQKIINTLSSHPDNQNNNHTQDNHSETFRNATAHLLVHAAAMDGHTDVHELEVAANILVQAFGDTPENAHNSIIKAQKNAEESENWYAALRTITPLIDFEERLNLLSHLWTVVLADNHIDPYEANFMRRMAGLLGVPDKNSNIIKMKIKQKN